MKRHILFVDDEPRLLDGLKRMLRPFRHEWDMEFAPGGAEALVALEQSPFDVLVTDMRMPGMSGIQLLEKVRSRFPALVRIVLTGQCDRDAALRSMALAHRQLAKPCETETIKETIARACALQELLIDANLQTLASRLESVPSLPSLYLKVTKELDEPEPCIQKIGDVISSDIGMATKIMQIVNSAAFGLRAKVVSPANAVVMLGTETVRALVLAANLFSQVKPSTHDLFAGEALWDRSLRISHLARGIAVLEKADEDVVEVAGTAGLLHDVGRLILAAELPAAYGEVMTRVRNEKVRLCDVERERFGSSHAELGAFLLGLWGLPCSLVEAVAWHHRPDFCPGDTFSPMTAVYLANVLEDEIAPGQLEPAEPLEQSYLERLGLLNHLDEWRAFRDQPAKRS
jgi:HD-like signal output (HDOD) protein/CheY-like chemotaxis protein